MDMLQPLTNSKDLCSHTCCLSVFIFEALYIKCTVKKEKCIYFKELLFKQNQRLGDTAITEGAILQQVIFNSVLQSASHPFD